MLHECLRIGILREGERFMRYLLLCSYPQEKLPIVLEIKDIRLLLASPLYPLNGSFSPGKSYHRFGSESIPMKIRQAI